MDACTDNKLYLAMNLAFACSMRMGEILGLQWERVHIADEDIANDDAHIFVDRELARVNNGISAQRSKERKQRAKGLVA